MIRRSARKPAFVKEEEILATTRGQVDAGDDLQQLKAIIAEQQQRLEALEAHSDAQNGEDTKEKRSTRRQMLKLAGATLIGAAGSAALRAIPAAAADGDTMLVGNVYTETFGLATGINGSSATYNVGMLGYAGYAGYGMHGSAGNYGRGVVGNAGAYGIGVQGSAGTYGTGVKAFGGYGGIAVQAAGNTTFGTGLIATGHNGVEAFGYNGGFGVFAASSTGPGVFGMGSTGVTAYTSSTASRAMYAYTSATSSVAIQAKATNPGGLFTGAAPAIAALSLKAMGTISYGYLGGVWSASTSTFSAGMVAFGYTGGPDLKLHGSGRMIQVANITGGVGAPNFTSKAGYFEMVRAKDGAMWINRGTGALKASWKRINAVRVDTADGTGAPFAPFRVYDSRSGAKKGAGSTTTVVIAPSGTGASSIPSDAVAIIGNLTATQYTGTGFLAISPAGVSVGTSSVNFITGQAAIANGFVVGLGTGVNKGKVQVKVAGHSSHILIDITGYLQ